MFQALIIGAFVVLIAARLAERHRRPFVPKVKDVSPEWVTQHEYFLGQGGDKRHTE